MSDAKKSGGRDISELKQRLGLKKAAAAQTGQSARQNGASGGVVAPPGLNLPPPPGLAQAPQQPVIPNAADDPFAAMNAIAAVGTAQRAPEIVIVNDGRPVEQVGASNRVATILKIALPALGGLIVGAFIATNGKNAAYLNDGISAAKFTYGSREAPSSFLGLKKTLNDVDTLLGSSGFKASSATTKQLAAMAKRLEIVDSKVFEARMNALPVNVVAQLTLFYSGVAELKGMIDTHVKLAVNDDVVLSAGKKKSDDATVKEGDTDRAAVLTGKVRYGVIVQPGDSGDFGAKLVELGRPYCNGKMSSSDKCVDAELTGIGARSDSGGVFSSVDAILTPQDSVAAKKLLTLLPSPMLDNLLAGSEAGAAQSFYVRRMRAIAERLGKLRQDSESLDTALKPIAESGKNFSYLFW